MPSTFSYLVPCWTVQPRFGWSQSEERPGTAAGIAAGVSPTGASVFLDAAATVFLFRAGSGLPVLLDGPARFLYRPFFVLFKIMRAVSP
jgi:hypothetical protein